jgi:4-diphosphocytidyl-2-C-methyl-D-erythritol kinase
LPLFLETPGEEEHYREILRALRELGADFAGLSGSGSGCFGIFTGGGRAKEAETALGRTWDFVKTAPFRSARGIFKG